MRVTVTKPPPSKPLPRGPLPRKPSPLAGRPPRNEFVLGQKMSSIERVNCVNAIIACRNLFSHSRHISLSPLSDGYSVCVMISLWANSLFRSASSCFLVLPAMDNTILLTKNWMWFKHSQTSSRTAI